MKFYLEKNDAFVEVMSPENLRKPSSRYFIASLLIHTTLLGIVLHLPVPKALLPESELVFFDLSEGSAPLAPPVSKGALGSEHKNTSPAATES
ncbi:MAG: hypothetical protein N2578_01935, partial [Bdellovibrionaceae bacterium]|nr:hypothetical protein [Pseudobdellovibrionaceae bacterium]